MKAYLEQLLIPNNSLYVAKAHKLPAYTTPHHFHRELELKYFIKGYGKGYLGDTIYDYGEQEVILIGSNIPHHWTSGPHFSDSGLYAESIYIQFTEECLGDDFLSKNENLPLRELLYQSKQCLRWVGKPVDEMAKLFHLLLHAQGIEKTLGFIQLLHTLSKNLPYAQTFTVKKIPVFNTCDKIQKVYNYLITQFKYEISLDKAAEIAQMDKTAFCRFFKQRTKKTFSDYVNELRINHAVALITQQKKSVQNACFESGFNNISYFNRKFKQLYGCTPKQYVKTK